MSKSSNDVLRQSKLILEELEERRLFSGGIEGLIDPGENQSLNPLTGLPSNNPDLLQNRPLAIKITNGPAEVRPQAGISFQRSQMISPVQPVASFDCHEKDQHSQHIQ